MSDTWLTIEEAAVALEVSLRTVNRQIAAGRLKSRLRDGRREVQVRIESEGESPASSADEESTPPPSVAPDPDSPEPPVPAQVPPPHMDAHDTGSTEAEPPPTSASTSNDPAVPSQDYTHHTPDAEKMVVLPARDLALSAYQTMTRTAEALALRSQRAARLAWSIVALTLLAVVLAIGWTTRHLTRAEVEMNHLQQDLLTARRSAEQASAERTALEQQMLLRLTPPTPSFPANSPPSPAPSSAATRPAPRPSIVDRLTYLMHANDE